MNPQVQPPLPGQRILLRTVVGSRLHGTVVPTSDTDVRTVYIDRTSKVLSIVQDEKPPKVAGADDNTWEFGHFVRLCLKGNPSTLEVLLAEPYETSEEGEQLRKLFPHFLSRKPVGGAFRGFAQRQRKDMFSLTSARINKAVSHYLRVCYNGRELLDTGTMTLRIIDSPVGKLVMDAKLGIISPEEGLEIGLQMEEQMEAAFRRSILPEQANIALVDQFQLRVRQSNW